MFIHVFVSQNRITLQVCLSHLLVYSTFRAANVNPRLTHIIESMIRFEDSGLYQFTTTSTKCRFQSLDYLFSEQDGSHIKILPSWIIFYPKLKSINDVYPSVDIKECWPGKDIDQRVATTISYIKNQSYLLIDSRSSTIIG